MNPPFEKQADIDHVLHALKFLKDDDILVSIMTCSVIFRENKNTLSFRNVIQEMNGMIVKNPSGSFKESGTMIETVTVVLKK